MDTRNMPNLWLEFARLNPRRWEAYDGNCLCEQCMRYRAEADRWIAARLATRVVEIETRMTKGEK